MAKDTLKFRHKAGGRLIVILAPAVSIQIQREFSRNNELQMRC